MKKARNTQEPWINHNLSDRYCLFEPEVEAVKAEPIRNGDNEYLDVFHAVYVDEIEGDSERKLLLKKESE